MTATLDIDDFAPRRPAARFRRISITPGSSLSDECHAFAVTEHLQREALYGGMEAAAGAAEKVQKAD